MLTASIIELLEACSQTGTWIELNANPYRLDMDWRWWKRQGPWNSMRHQLRRAPCRTRQFPALRSGARPQRLVASGGCGQHIAPGCLDGGPCTQTKKAGLRVDGFQAVIKVLRNAPLAWLSCSCWRHLSAWLYILNRISELNALPTAFTDCFWLYRGCGYGP